MTDTPPDPLPPGYRIGSYRIESELAPATMGRVYKASQTLWNKIVAINVLAPELQDDEHMARFFDCIRRAYEKRRDAERNPILDIRAMRGDDPVIKGGPVTLAQALIVALFLTSTNGGSAEQESTTEPLTAADIVWSYDTGG